MLLRKKKELKILFDIIKNKKKVKSIKIIVLLIYLKLCIYLVLREFLLNYIGTSTENVKYCVTYDYLEGKLL